MNRSTRIRILLLITLPALVAAAASVIGMLLSPDLPDPMAVHWGIDGSVDRLGGLDSYIVVVALLVPLFVAGVLGFSFSPLRTGTSRLFVRTVIGLSTWFGVFISVSMFLGVQTQRGVTDAAVVPISSVVAPLLIGFGVALAAAAVGVLVAPRVPEFKRPSADAIALDIHVGEQVYWSKTARSPRGVIAIPIGAMLLIVVLFTIVGVPAWLSIVVALLLASLCTMLAWRVVIDRRGLTITGLFGFPRFHVPLENVVEATVVDVSAMRDFAGWGIRIGRTGSWGVVARSGEAIEVQRRHGTPFVVTVDDAATGAGLLTSLARRTAK
jgi:hypothetical protein